MTLDQCSNNLPLDKTDFFFWHPNNLTLSGTCGSGYCPFTMNGYNITFGACNMGTLNSTCVNYFNLLSKANYVGLQINIINFYQGTNPAAIFALANTGTIL